MKISPFPFFILVLCFAPLAFAASDPWAMATVEILIGCVALFFVFQKQIDGKGTIYRVPGLLPLLLILVWMVIQVIPLPVSIVKLLSPTGYQLYRPIYELFDGQRFMPITVQQKATLTELLRLGSYFFFYFLTIQLLSSKDRLKKIVKIIIWLATLIGLFAIVQKLTSPDKIYWFRSVPVDAQPFGPWIYHTNFAAFMEMICPLALALFLYYRPSVNSSESLRIRIASLFSMPGSSAHFLMGLSLAVIAASVFMSLSRSGIIIVCVASIFFMLQVSTKRTQDIRLISTILFFSGVLLLAWFKWDQVSAGLDPTLHKTGRVGQDLLGVWQDAINIIRHYFITGSGFGTFPHILTAYSSIAGTAAYHHAHNDYIELFSEGGLLSFLLFGWFILAIMLHGWKMIRRRRDHYAILITFGAGTGIISMLVHSLADFSMHNGAIGLYFFFLCGLLVAAVNTRQHHRTKPTMLKLAAPNRRIMVTIAALVLLSMTGLFQGGRIMAERQVFRSGDISFTGGISEDEFEEALLMFTQAGRYDPLESKYPAQIGKLEIAQDNPERALEAYIKAARKDPLAGSYLQQIGLLLASTDQEQAKKIMAEGYARAASREDVVVPWAQWLLDNNNREQAIEVLKSGIDYQPTLIGKIIPMLDAYSFEQQEVITVLSSSVGAWIQYGEFMQEQGNTEASEFFRKGALKYLEQEDTIKPYYFKQLYTFYNEQGQDAQALTVLRQAVKKLPGHAPFHEQLGDYYLKEGIKYRAQEEYEQVLVLEPENDEVRKKLTDLKKSPIQRSINFSKSSED